MIHRATHPHPNPLPLRGRGGSILPLARPCPPARGAGGGKGEALRRRPRLAMAADKGQSFAPGATIGILGGGQLGRMTALAAARLGFRCHVFATERDSPTEQVCGAATAAEYDDGDALDHFAAA